MTSTRGIDIGIAVTGVPPVLTSLDQVRARIRQTGQEAKGMTDFLKEAGRQVLSGLGVGVGMGMFQHLASAVTAAVESGVRYNAVLETQSIAFKTLLGDAAAAQARMQDLARFAASTPFELPEVVNASRLLQTLTGGALASGDALRLVGDAAAASGRGFEETAMWVGRLYAGLESGTPVGEATLRLLEMGLVSGETKIRLDRLAESGEAAGRAAEIVRSAFHRTSGAMEEQSKTLAGLQSTLKDSVNELAGLATSPLLGPLKAGIDSVILSIQTANKALETGHLWQLVTMGTWGTSAVVSAAMNAVENSPGARWYAGATEEVDQKSLPGWQKVEEHTAKRRAEALAAGQGPMFGPGTAEGEAAWLASLEEVRREAEFRRDVEMETGLAIGDQIAAERERQELVEKQVADRQRILDIAIKEEQRRQDMAYRQSYVGGTATRFGQFQDASAVDNQAGIGGGMIAGLQQSMMQLGTTAQQVGGFIQSSVGGALSGISAAIEGLIQGTMTWAKAFQTVGTAVLNAVVSAFAQMTAQMIVSFVLQRTFGQVIKKEAASVGAAWHAAAISASIATEGSAAGIGLSAFLAAQGAGTAAAAGMQSGFLEGGYTGDGPETQVAGVVHRGEFVVPASVVNRVGLAPLQEIVEPTGARSQAIGPEGGRGWDSSRYHIYINRQDFLDAMRDDLEGIAVQAIMRRG